MQQQTFLGSSVNTGLAVLEQKKKKVAAIHHKELITNYIQNQAHE